MNIRLPSHSKYSNIFIKIVWNCDWKEKDQKLESIFLMFLLLFTFVSLSKNLVAFVDWYVETLLRKNSHLLFWIFHTHFSLNTTDQQNIRLPATLKMHLKTKLLKKDEISNKTSCSCILWAYIELESSRKITQRMVWNVQFGLLSYSFSVRCTYKSYSHSTYTMIQTHTSI